MAEVKRRRRSKTGETQTTWRAKFAEAARICKTQRAPGERIQDCIRRVLKGA